MIHLAQSVVAHALRLGATDAEAVGVEGEEFSVHVRLGEVEQLTESGSRALGLRVFFAQSGSDSAEGAGQRTASTSTSDLSTDGLKRLVEGAVSLARVSGIDAFAGLPEREAFGSNDVAAQHLFFEDVDAIAPTERIDIARRCEAAALGYDTRIGNSKGASFDASHATRTLVNSRGFSASYKRSYCGFACTPIAQDAHGMQSDHWYSSARTAQLLASPEDVGRIAAERALRRLGARRVPTQRCPVVFPRRPPAD